jgi:hypothetical protein
MRLLVRCERRSCTHERRTSMLAPGWVSERICDDYRCRKTGEHLVHTSRQQARIAEQRAIRTAHAALGQGATSA